MDRPSEFSRLVDESCAAIGKAVGLQPGVLSAARAIEEALLTGRKILTCGNGGSAADAAHLAAELIVRFRDERPSYPALCLSADGAVLTAGGNDYSFAEVFARQISGLGSPGDVLVVFSTSGQSENIVRALETAQLRNLRTVALLGKGGGRCRGLAEFELIVEHAVTARIQEVHHFLLHAFCELIEPALAAKMRGS